MAGTCLLALCLGETVAAMEIIGILGLSMLLESYAAGRSRQSIKKNLAEVTRNTLAAIEDGIQVESEIFPSCESHIDALARRLLPLGTLAGAGTLLVSGDISNAFSAVLAVICPCASVLSSTAALNFALSNAARSHISIKSGLCLEIVEKADSFYFDEAVIKSQDSSRMIDAVFSWLRNDGVHAVYLISEDRETGAGIDPQASEPGGRCTALLSAGKTGSSGIAGVVLKIRSCQPDLDAADIILKDSSLEQLVCLRQLSHKTFRIIEQNRWLAFSINALGLTLEFADWLSPLVKVLLHFARALGILGNSSRLLTWNPPGLKNMSN